MLSISLVLIFLTGSGLFYFAYRRLNTMAGEVGIKVAAANDSQNTLQKLLRLQQDLEANKSVVEKSTRIAANGENFNYQDQIVSDLTAYASSSGMVISNITFAAPTGGAAVAPAGGTIPVAPSGPSTTAVTVTLQNPVSYTGLLTFLHHIEQNLTRFKIANVTLSKSDKDKVVTDSLSLEVYLR